MPKLINRPILLSLATAAGALAIAAPRMAAAPNPQMRQVLAQLADYKQPPITSLPPAQARNLETPANAAAEVLAKEGKPAIDPTVDVDHTVIPGPVGKLVARIYRPENSLGRPLPVAVYFHGGGWVIANLDTYDASCRALAKMADCMVVSVAYRQAPENKFPAAHEDAYASTQYVMKNVAKMGGDPNRVAIVGESAGGNLATAVCIMAKQRHGRMPKAQVLVYPIAQYGDFNTPSYRENANAQPLNRPMMQWFFNQYLRTPADGRTAWVSPLRAGAAMLRGLPPATVILAQIDPLRSEGEAYAHRLQNAGVRTTWKVYPGVTHEFFGMGAVVDEAMQAEQQAASALKEAFAR